MYDSSTLQSFIAFSSRFNRCLDITVFACFDRWVNLFQSIAEQWSTEAILFLYLKFFICCLFSATVSRPQINGLLKTDGLSIVYSLSQSNYINMAPRYIYFCLKNKVTLTRLFQRALSAVYTSLILTSVYTYHFFINGKFN